MSGDVKIITIWETGFTGPGSAAYLYLLESDSDDEEMFTWGVNGQARFSTGPGHQLGTLLQANSHDQIVVEFISQIMLNNLDVYWEEDENVVDAELEEIDKGCTCSIPDLMAHGCKCGGW